MKALTTPRATVAVSVRLTPAEHAFIQSKAAELSVSVTRLITNVAVKLATKLGAEPRRIPPAATAHQASVTHGRNGKTSSVKVRVFERDIACMAALKQSTSMIETDEDAIRQAARAYWETRGLYIVDKSVNEIPPTEVCAAQPQIHI